MSKKLTAFEEYVLLKKGTERPDTGLYTHLKAKGTFHCKACDAPLYESSAKFDSGCGWPSFDQDVSSAVLRKPDADGRRIEIVCANCQGHLGHVFEGEKFTDKNTRHCVNSVSIKFVPDLSVEHKSAVFASGCFWGTEYFLARVPGVIQTTVGYIGGHMIDPDYKSVCSGSTGHVEGVEVIYDPSKTNYETLTKIFFETHNFSQTDGQGPDIGSQYLSVLFYADESELKIAQMLVSKLKNMGHVVATKLQAIEKFWPGEDYHRQYYERQGERPYCHRYRKLF